MFNEAVFSILGKWLLTKNHIKRYNNKATYILIIHFKSLLKFEEKPGLDRNEKNVKVFLNFSIIYGEINPHCPILNYD